MAEPTREELFRRHLGSILLLKEELESQFSTALAAAHSPDDYTKLTAAAVKTERELQKIKLEISATAGKSLVIRPTSSVSHPIQHGVPHSNLTLPGPLPTAPSNSSSPESSTSGYGSVESFPARTGYSAAVAVRHPSPPAQPHSGPSAVPDNDQKTKVYRAQPGTSAMVRQYDWRDTDVPDKHKIFLPHISFKTTENGLGHFFQQFGKVVHVRIFSVPPKDPTVPIKGNLATVGFDEPRAATALIGRAFVLDDAKLSPREYISREKYHITLKKERYQIFVGGVPSNASPDDIALGLQEHLCDSIRDIQVIYHRNQTGKQAYHRGFAYVDLESDDDAKYLLHHRFIYVNGKKAECKANTCSFETITKLQNGMFTDTYEDEEDPSGQDAVDEQHNSSSGPNRGSVTQHVNEGWNSVSKQIVEKCVICRVNPRDSIFLWCCHNETCMECAEKIQTCPKVGCGELIVMRQLKVKPQ